MVWKWNESFYSRYVRFIESNPMLIETYLINNIRENDASPRRMLKLYSRVFIPLEESSYVGKS